MANSYSKFPTFSAQDISRFWTKVQIAAASDCWLWAGTRTPQNYGRFSMRFEGREYHVTAHRAMYRLRYGVDPGVLNVLHRCDNPPCVNPDHLFLGTAADNVADKMRKGRQARGAAVHCKNQVQGENSHFSKLTWPQVDRMRELYAQGVKPPALAVIFDVTKENAWLIVTHKTWRRRSV